MRLQNRVKESISKDMTRIALIDFPKEFNKVSWQLIQLKT